MKAGKAILFLLLILFLVGCTESDQPVNSTNQPTDVIPKGTEVTLIDIDITPSTEQPISPEETSQPEQITEPGPNLIIDSRLSFLPGGLYLVFYDLEKETLEALSFQLKLTTIGNGNGIFQHSDNTLFALVGQKLINLQTRENFLVPEFGGRDDCTVSSISRTGDLLVAGCEENGAAVFSIGGDWELLYPDYQFSQIQLSPDHEQIAFCMLDGTSRLYRSDLQQCMLEGQCDLIQISSTCDDVLFDWSPDAKLIAFSEQRQGIELIELSTGSKTELLTSTQTGIMDDIAWSPDGRFIAYTQTEKELSSIYLFNVLGSEPRLFYQSENQIKLVGWLNAITDFNPTEQYIVLPSENQFWMKAGPSVDDFDSKLFLAGEKVRVMDQVEVVDGQKWWRVRVGDSIGWVVESSNHFQDDWTYGLLSPVFEPGRPLIVKMSGNDLRLREMPSLNGVVKRYLIPGMRLKIIDGPAVVDKFNWWLVEIEESKIYGWVAEEALWYATD
ncbi:MAG: GW dipeptide domain-containing protein [Anaerolineaceae bacterium]|nr:GW dipeptide domain-containing protein [Anaerolineaceae bacterium]